MDTNRDGIIDDPLVTKKKCGRKSLGLTPEEMKAHREVLRKARRDKKRAAERKAAFDSLVTDVIYSQACGLSKDEIVETLTRDKRYTLSYQDGATSISGFKGGRLKRQRR